MKKNFLFGLLLLTILPITTIYPSEHSAEVEGEGSNAAVPSARPLSPNDPSSQPGTASAANKAILADAAAHITVLVGKPIEPINIEDPNAEGDKKKKDESAGSSLSAAGVIAGATHVVNGAIDMVRTGVKKVKDSRGRNLLDRLAERQKANVEFASDDPVADQTLILQGVQDSTRKNKSENVELMIDGLHATKAKVPELSRRALREFVTSERDEEVNRLNVLLEEKVNELLAWYAQRSAPLIKKDALRKTTFKFDGCTSDDEDELHMVPAETLKGRFSLRDGSIKVAKITKKNKKIAQPSANHKSDKEPANRQSVNAASAVVAVADPNDASK